MDVFGTGHGCSKSYVPKSRVRFWQDKFDGNVRRDRKNQSLLVEAGWRVLVLWECEIGEQEVLLERLVAFLGPPGISR